MDVNDVLFELEHRIIPNLFYEDPMGFITMARERADYLYETFGGMCSDKHIDNPYSIEQFNMESAIIDREVVVARLTFPEPGTGPLCYRIYLMADQEGKRPLCFTAEQGEERDGGALQVCLSTANGEHIKCGRCGMEEGADLLRCLSVYREEKR